MKTIYIGWDSREWEAYDVAKKSILAYSDWEDLRIVPLELHSLKIKALLTRPIERRGEQLWCPISEAPMSTEFAISRFCVPFLQNNGWALFIDCDVLCLADIGELFALADDKYAVMVVKHTQESGPTTKMDNQLQTFYNRKNWSSMVLWNTEHSSNQRLTREALNTWPGRDLHAFKWLNDDEIGELPNEWNYLVGVNPPMENPKLVHFTLGGCWIEAWTPAGEWDELWLKQQSLLNFKLPLEQVEPELTTVG